MMRRTVLFLVCVLLIAPLGTSCGLSATAQNNLNWIPFSQASLPQLQQQLQREYQRNNVPVDVGRMRVLKIQKAGQTLYLIDTRVTLEPKQIDLNPACGKAGCEFEGYVQKQGSYQQVLAVYLDPYPPPGKPLIEPASERQNGLPCLNFYQRQKAGRIEVVRWCYDGQRYQFVHSTLQQS